VSRRGFEFLDGFYSLFYYYSYFGGVSNCGTSEILHVINWMVWSADGCLLVPISNMMQ
jgi:hypothetical protein